MLLWLFILASASALYLPRTHEVSHVPLDPPHVLTRRSFDQQIRFKVHFDETVNRLNANKQDYVMTMLVGEAVKYWEQVLRVKQTTSAILLNRDCINGKFFIQSGEPRHCDRDGLSSGCKTTTVCGTVTVPSDHLQACYSCNRQGRNCLNETDSQAGSGVTGVDYVLYVSSEQTGLCGTGLSAAENVAYAGHCQQEQSLDRPVAGFVNLCPDTLSQEAEDYAKQLAIVKHEILHALGFSSALYAFYRNSSGNPRTSRDSNNLPSLNLTSNGIYQWSNSTLKSVTRSQWRVSTGTVSHTVHMMVTPRVKQAVREHFNCDSLEGAEVENQGASATRLTHWEKRVFENEAMTGTFTQNPVFSDITFALLEDTGWYMPDYSLAQQLEWGRGLGCDFAKGSCGGWIDDKQSSGTVYPFCERLKNRTPLKLECTVDQLAVAICNLVQYPATLDANYQYFSSLPDETIDALSLKKYGGFVSLADYCPYNQEFKWTKNGVAVRGTQCRVVENNPDLDVNLALETYGANSLCIGQGRSWSRRTDGNVATAGNWGSGCYKVSCNNSDPYLTIHINGHSYACHQEGEMIMVTEDAGNSRYTGSLICPEKHSACWGLKDSVNDGAINPSPNGEMPWFATRMSWQWVLLLVAYCLFF